MLTYNWDRTLDPLALCHARNPIGQLSRCCVEYYGAWRDAFAQHINAAMQLNDLSWEMQRVSSNAPPGTMCKEAFFEGSDWGKIRFLARLALKEANMPLWPLPKVVDFSEYIEIVLFPDSSGYRP